MRFVVPQFIEYEVKIIGPFTFKQFIYVGVAGVICFIVYYSAPFFIFLISCFVLGGISLAFAFLKIGGRGLPTILANMLRFRLTPKMYIWQKKEAMTIVYKKEEPPSVVSADENKEELPLKIAAKSQLKKISTEIETKTR